MCWYTQPFLGAALKNGHMSGKLQSVGLLNPVLTNLDSVDTGAIGSFDLDTHCHNCQNKHIDHESQMMVERRGVISHTVDSSGAQYGQSVATEGRVFLLKTFLLVGKSPDAWKPD